LRCLIRGSRTEAASAAASAASAMAAAASAAAFSAMSWSEAAAARSDRVCDAEDVDVPEEVDTVVAAEVRPPPTVEGMMGLGLTVPL
jgi:hypothetical protein